MTTYFNWNFPYPSQRMPVLANNVVSTSQPLASQAGLRMILKGGNAVDAIIAAAITLTVVEPISNGLGSDAFAILWDGEKIMGLNASGRSPAAWTSEYFSRYKTMPALGWDSVTVPGAVSAWVELWRKYGQLSFKELFEPAIKYAKDGYLVSPIIGQGWHLLKNQYKQFPEFCNAFLRNKRAPKIGELFQFPAQAHSLELIADTEGEAFYRGELAKKIVDYAKETGGLMTLDDLANHNVTWEKTINVDYKDVVLHEIPPNGQGLATLIMLGILKQLDIGQYDTDSPESLHLQIEAMKLAFADAYRYISDPAYLEFDLKFFLEEEYLKERASLIDLNNAQDSKHGVPKHGDTVYLTAADSNGMMVSYIQSNFWSFGSGIVVPYTGISFQNRGNGFVLEKGHPNQVGPNKRPFHTIMPAFVTKKGQPLMSFGVMGGPMQPQGHAQMMIRIFQYGQNPQAAVDAPRWRVMQGFKVNLEVGYDKSVIEGLKQRGHEIHTTHYLDYGGAQIIYKLEDGYLAASDPRKDGQAVGF